MTLGQVLAMIAKGEQPSRNMAPQAQASIPLPWSQIATAPEPEPGYITKQPVEVTATRLPPLPETMDPLSMYETELYGGPITRQEYMGAAQAAPMPQPSYAFTPTPQPLAAKLPPLPIQGYAPVQQPEITTRAPRAMTDVPQEEPMAMATGEDVAMLAPVAQPQVPAAPTAEDAKAEEERKKQEAARLWRPTDDFTVTYKDKIYTIPGGTFKIGQQATVALPSGRIANLQQSDNPELYDAISTEFQNRIQAAQPPEQDKDFSSEIFVEDEGWVRAKVEPSTGTVYYKDKEGSVWRYPTPLDLQLDENYRGPALEDRDPGADLEMLKTSIRNPLVPYFERLSQTGAPFKRVAASSEVMQRIKPVWGTEKGEGYNIFPKVDWTYEVGQGAQKYKISLDEAISQGLVSPSVRESLDQAADAEIKSIEQSAAQFGSMMGTKAPSMRQEDLNRIDEAIAANEDQKKKVTSPRELAALQKESVKLQKIKSNILSRLTTSVQAGGVTVTEAPQAERGASLDPNNPLDALAIARAGATIEPGVGATPRFTLDDLGEDIKDKASSGFEQAEYTPGYGYTESMRKLIAKLNPIQLDANENERYANNPSKVLDENASFYYYNSATGKPQTVTSTLRNALESYMQAEQNFRDAVAQAGVVAGGQEELAKARTEFISVASMLSGTVTLPELGTYPLQGSISQISNYESDTPQYSLQTKQISTINPSIIESKPAPVDTTAPKSGRPDNVVPKTSWFPGWEKGSPAENQPDKVKVNKSFRLSDMINMTNRLFAFTADKYSPVKANATVAKDMGRALGRDDGTLTQAGVNAVSQSIAKANNAMIQKNEDGKQARAAYSAMAYHALNSMMGGQSYISLDPTGFASRLEDIFNAKTSYDADQAIKKLMADSSVTDFRRFADTETAVKIAATDKAIPGNKYSEAGVPVLFGQIKAFIYDLGMLYKNGGLFNDPTTPGAEKTWQGTTSKPTITWFADWTKPAGRTGNIQSALTIPAPSLNTGMAPVQNAKDTKGKDALSVPLDPTMPRILEIGSQQILLEADRLYNYFGKTGVFDPVLKQAEQGWKENVGSQGGNAYMGATDWRKEDEDGNTEFDQDSRTAVAKVFTGSNILYNLFPESRLRGKK